MAASFYVALVFRLACAFTQATFFQPDEYFQAWEVAYSDVFGDGFRSWEWLAGIRTSLVPRLFAVLIRIGIATHINYLVISKVLMAFVAATADVYAAKVSDLVFPGTGKSAFFLSLFSMFNWYVSTRPFSNTLEMMLITVALFYWLRNRGLVDMVSAQVLAQISIALRPNAGVFWMVLGIDTLLRSGKKIKLVVTSVLVAVVVQGATTYLDFQYYNSAKLPLLEFAKLNFGTGISEIYGVMPWHWYISQGVPLLLLGYIPFFLVGWYRASKRWKLILTLNLVCFSLISHKEFRFIYFLLPLMHAFSVLGLSKFPRWFRRVACLVNVLVAIYFSVFHQRGVVDVVNYIKQEKDISDVTFLMPCHSTPWFAHFQRHDPAFQPTFLTCNPPWNVSSAGYIDEADRFYLNPMEYIESKPELLTKTIVVFEPLKNLMEGYNYTVKQQFFNGLFNDDDRRKGDVLLMQAI